MRVLPSLLIVSLLLCAGCAADSYDRYGLGEATEVVGASDFSGSTSAMIKHVQDSNAPRYLLLTECAMGDNIVAENPEKDLLRLCSHRCPHMGEITLEMTRDALKFNQHIVEVDEEIRVKAKRAVDRMLAVV
jgi:quinolinate synthase